MGVFTPGGIPGITGIKIPGGMTGIWKFQAESNFSAWNSGNSAPGGIPPGITGVQESPAKLSWFEFKMH